MKRKDKKNGWMVEIARFGNFLVKRYGDGWNQWLRVTTVNGDWRMDFRDDSLKYGWIANCLASGSEAVIKAVEMWIVIAYHTAQVWPDPEYLDEAADCLGRLQDRVSRKAIEEEKKEEAKKN